MPYPFKVDGRLFIIHLFNLIALIFLIRTLLVEKVF